MGTMVIGHGQVAQTSAGGLSDEIEGFEAAVTADGVAVEVVRGGTWLLYTSPSPMICEAIDRQLENLGLLRTCGTDSHGIDLGGR